MDTNVNAAPPSEGAASNKVAVTAKQSLLFKQKWVLKGQTLLVTPDEQKELGDQVSVLAAKPAATANVPAPAAPAANAPVKPVPAAPVPVGGSK
jgi:hypothetical protein